MHGSVVYIGTLSKVLAPGLRLGYVVAAAPVVERLADARWAIDRQGDHAGERAVAELVEDGVLARHGRRMRGVYLARRNLLVHQLAVAFGDRLEIRPPSGGMALWVRVRLPPSKVVAWERRALDRGVAFTAGERYVFDRRATPFARMGFAALDEGELREAVARLARAW